MANIQQGHHSAVQNQQQVGQSGIDPSLLQQQQKDRVDLKDSVNRGYSEENTVSTNKKQEDIAPPIKSQHNLDAPVKGSDSPSQKVLKEISVYSEIQKLSQTDPEAVKLGLASEELIEQGGPDVLGQVTGDLKSFEEGTGGRPNPLASHISSMQSNKDHLLSMGYSEDLIDGMLKIADPNDPDNSLKSMHSFSAQVGGKLAGDDSLEKLSDLFADTFNKVANLKGGPKDLQKELQAELKAFNATFLDANKHLDVDAATEMLMRIQTKLQDSRLVFNQENIKINEQQRQQISEKRLAKIAESIEKAEKAKESGQISRIFGYIAVALMAVVMVVMFATGVGSPVAMGLMAAALALTVMMTVSSETGDWMNKGVAAMFEAFGADKKGAMIGAMVFWSVVILALSLGGAAAGWSASAASTAATATAQATAAGTGGAAAAATVTASATTAATTTAKISKMAVMAARFSRLARITGGAAMVADGSASAHSTTMNYQADMLRAEAKELYAWMLANQHVIDGMTEDIAKVIEDMQQVWQVMTGMMKDNHDTMTKLNAALKG
ncbi:type III secretion system translocon subunit SctE [Endozoicomonas sp. SCSIO W0465]|uniref:type III secretion system translocon subunit SctE n=1 Tax=Endozoicomonas sp. SCSIO W0465 TaxID=2918516 RepID=UPI002075FE98|nr:type III secretion system translocon subunit SctE [Endozoicomonas sp. SCSIO W0465]USE35286.1 type III secretion system translocon subunit SctE [Endozoicomonas sp. SCSIO W0465]